MKLIIVTVVLAITTCLSLARPPPLDNEEIDWETFIRLLSSTKTPVSKKGHSRLDAFNTPDQSLEDPVGDIWSNCGSNDDMSIIKNVTITPDPPKANQPVTVDAYFILKENITGGSFTAKVKYSFFPTVTNTIQVCDLAKLAGLKCPIPQNTDHIHITQKLPFILPSGHYKGQVIGTDQTGKRIGCINIDVHI